MKKLIYAFVFMAVACFMSACQPEEKYCDVTFWIDSDNVEQIIDVHFYSDETGYDASREITKFYSSSTPECGDDGCANFHVKEGKYYFKAENDYYYWDGEMNVYEDCHKMKLYVGDKSYAKPGAQPTGVSEIEPAYVNFDISKIVND